MKGILLCLSSVLLSFSVVSQNEDAARAFDSVFYNIAVHVSSANPPKAMHLADSLYTYSTTEKQRLKSLMLKADILEKQEKRGEAIQQALKALKIAKAEKDYSFQARIYGFLSTQYRTIGFWDKGKESIQKGVATSLNMEDKEQVIKYKGMADQEMAEYAIEEKDYTAAIDYIQMAMLSYDREENEKFRNFLIGNSEEMLGRAYMGLDEKEKALEHFSKANSEINKADAGNSLWAGLIYQGYANALMETQNLDSAHVYLRKALGIAENGSHGSLKQNVYKTAADYYKQSKEADSFSKYNSRFNTLLVENNAKKRAMINSAYHILNENPENTGERKSLYLGIGAVSFLLIASVVFLKRKTLFASKNAPNGNGNKNGDLVLSQKTEEEILQKLNEFETSTDFLDKDMSMSVLIGRLNTNNKYFRQILKKYKDKDYNTYINELRINYIVNKLQTDPDYLHYKISYLADESGFSSHSKFSAEFRKVTQLSPSQFIESIRD